MARTKNNTNQARPYNHLRIYRTAYNIIIEETKRHAGLETGGILMGYIEQRHWNLIVTHATLPGPRAIHKPNYFLRDRVYCQTELDYIHQQTQGRIHYVGEWHKHLELDPKPSRLDKESLTSIAAQPNYETNLPLLIICGFLAQSNDGQFALCATLFNSSGIIKRYSRIHLIEGEFNATSGIDER